MNYVQISGGLGNQLFQYMFAKYLERMTGHSSVLYTEIYEINNDNPVLTKRHFALDKLNCNYITATGRIICADIVTEDYDDIGPSTDNLGFNGYWQDIRYYYDMKDIIPKHAMIRPDLITDDLRNEMEMISATESAALHVRRTDYLNNCNAGFTKQTMEYYSCAVNMIINKIGCKPVLYIFSDDYDYILSNMEGLCGCDTIMMKPRADYEDLHLMVCAKHHVIANSTFSWWGAILSEYTGGITIAPKVWFNGHPTPPLIHKDWITL